MAIALEINEKPFETSSLLHRGRKDPSQMKPWAAKRRDRVSLPCAWTNCLSLSPL